VDVFRKHKYHTEDHRSSIRGSKEVGLGIKAKQTKYMFMSCHKNAGQIMILTP
jgi:hypothetical protein